MKQTANWALLFVAGILIVVIGFTGSLGKVFAVCFTPGLLSNESPQPFQQQF